MLYILIIILIIMAITVIVLKNKNALKLNSKIILSVLLICIFIFTFTQIFIKIPDIIFFFQSLEYENVDKYDYSNDISDNGYISKEGAIKIAKEKTDKQRIAKVSCEIVENGNEATFWLITFTTGWDYLCAHEEEWYFKIDYYTGKILQWDVTM